MSVRTLYHLTGHPPGMIAVPSVEWMWTQSARALVNMSYTAPLQSALVLSEYATSPALSRNTLIQRFLLAGVFEWILFVDSDMTPDSDTLARLLSHGLDVVGAVCFQRSYPFVAVIKELPEDPLYEDSTGLHEVEWTGGACLLVRRSVLERIPAPWFEHPSPGTAEDVVFCKKVRALGVPIYVDFDCTVGHVSVQPITKQSALMLQKFEPERSPSQAEIIHDAQVRDAVSRFDQR
jgi:hypothetical protein